MSVQPTLPGELRAETLPPRSTYARWGIGLYLLFMAALAATAIRLFRLGCGAPLELTALMFGANLLGALAFALLGSVVLVYRRDNRIGWLCCMIGPAQVATLLAYLGLRCGATGAFLTTALPYFAWFAYCLIPLTGVLPMFVFLPLVFPTGRFLSPRWARVTGAAIVVLLVAGVAMGLAPDFRRLNSVTFSIDLDNPFGVHTLPDWWHPLFVTLSLAVMCGLCFLGMAAVIVRFRRSTGDERQQMKWLTYFLCTVVAVQLLVFELPGNLYSPAIFQTIWYDLIILCVVLGFPLTIAVAVFKYRLYDIDLIIRRTLVYGALTALLVGLYALIVSALGAVFHNGRNFATSLLAAAVIAVVFQPARLWLQRLVNRRFFGARDDPAEVLTRLADQMESAGSGQSLLSNLVATVATSLKLPYASVWIRDGDGSHALAAEIGRRPARVETLPLMHQQEVVGQLVVAPRSPGEALVAADRRLLVAVARLMATTARMVELNDEVQDARIRTVAAREEERRRLRRDLHDGLGPMLAGQGLKLAAARQLLRARPEVAERLLDEVMRQGEATVADVRRLVYALRPPTLDELGLLEAIREHVDAVGATASTRIALDAPELLPEIPAAIEVAAFRIVQEALSNVLAHARAARCTITLRLEEALLLTVEDDGCGLPAAPRAGIGLLSMCERAAEVGGACRIENGAAGGAAVRVALPLGN